ncbi:MAG: universal stress protein [Acidimicrobiales bacterium]
MATKDHRVIVGVDGSDSSLEALRWAVDYGRAVGAVVQAIRTWHYPWAMQTAPAQTDASVEKQIQGELDDAVARAGIDTSDVTVERVVKEGHASLVLVNESATADLLVVGSRGRGEFAGMLLGSVSQHCAHGAHCPVVIVRHDRG